MKMRKLIALLSAVLMLCTVIPMGAMTVTAAASDITTNFDNGSRNGWSGPTCSADAAYSGAYGVTATSTSAWGSLLKKTAALEKHTSYKISFWFKSNADALTNASFEMKDPNSAKVPLMNVASTSYTLNKSVTDWTQVELYFTTGDYTDVQFLFYRGSDTAGDAASICVDEIVLEEVDVTTDGYIVDGGFESGSLNFTPNSLGSITSDAHTGSYAVTGTSATKYDIYAQKYVRVEKNTDYTFKFWAKSSGSGKIARAYVNAKKFSTTSSNDLRGNYSQHTINTGWAEYEVTFNSGANTEIALTLCSSGSTATYYFDDLTLIGPSNITPEEPEEPGTTTNLMVNGDLETGDTTGWESYSGTTIATSPVHGGSYSLKSVNTTTKYQTMAKHIITTTASTDYTLTYWYYYDGSNAQPSFYTYIQDTAGTNLTSLTTYPSAAGTWGQVTLNFNSGANTSILVYVKNRTEGDGGTYYFDDFAIPVTVEEPEEPENPEEAPDTGLVTNGNFETGITSPWSVHHGTAVTTAAAKTGSYGLHGKGSGWNGIASTTINVENGKSYKLSFWYKINVAGFNWKITGVNTGTQYNSAPTWVNTNLGTWQQITLEFIADDTQVKLNISGLDETSSPDFYLDDVILVEVKGPSNDGFIVNGDFEVGTSIGWEVYQSTVVSTAAAKDGSYGVNLKGNGGWGGMLKQNFTTKKGYKYILTLDLKVNTYGINLAVKNNDGDGDYNNDASLVSAWKTNTEWESLTYEFVAISTSSYLNFNGGGNGAAQGLTEDVYVDNIKIVEIPCEHTYDGIQDADCNVCGEIREVPLVDIVTGGQTSASEDVSGLAFKFEIEATGATVNNNNQYVAGSASIKPFGNDDYTLIAMGAVITNKADKATNELLNLNTVNGKSVINIEAVYLLESDSDSLAFATRIINIPDAGKDTTIYARSYYVFEKDGEILVVYDDIVSQTYADAIG